MVPYIFQWRGEFTNEELNALHAEAFAHPVLAVDWIGQVQTHSLGWVTAREGRELIGFVNVPWDGAIHAFIVDAIVSARVQRRGVGTRLVDIAAHEASAAGSRWLHVDFDEKHREFYLGRCGFRPTSAGLLALQREPERSGPMRASEAEAIRYAPRVPLSRFSRHVLRTTDVAAATAFYDAVLGQRRDEIVPLPEAAIARGARPLWLGHIGVSEVGGAEVMAARFVERGALHLGPTSAAGDVVLRDPGGAFLALTDARAEPTTGVVWYQLNTRDRAAAEANYTALFGWSFTEQLELGVWGRHQCFAFGAGEPAVGVFSDVESRPEVHTQWLFYFGVRSLDVAIERVQAHGGLVLGPIELPNGARVAACDDPQGAAFGLIEHSHAGGRPQLVQMARGGM